MFIKVTLEVQTREIFNWQGRTPALNSSKELLKMMPKRHQGPFDLKKQMGVEALSGIVFRRSLELLKARRHPISSKIFGSENAVIGHLKNKHSIKST